MAEQRVIANVNDLQDGQMKQVDLDEDRSILLVRVDGEFHALGSTCPHHGAPLADGILEGHRVVCPWHQSVFDAISGGYIEPPTFDGIPVYETRVEGENVVVDLPDKLASSTRPELATHDAGADQRTTVIVGSGAAGFLAAQSMREGDYRGRIVMITQEQVAPYDRTELSKRYLAKPDAPEPFLRPEKFYTRFGIDLQPGREVTEVDPEAKTVACADGTEYSYDRLLLATGSRPRQLPVEGAELENVRLLRTFADCEFLRAQAGQINRAVVVGASFIGMEVAGSLASRGVHVTVIAPESVPFELVMGRPVGRMYQQVHEENGNEFRMGRKVQRFEGDGKVEAVVLDDGERLEAEMVVIGIGVEPVTDYLKGIVANEKGAVSVDTRLQVPGMEGIYAAGDIATYPDWRTGEPIRIEHWRLAQQHGRVAGMNLAGRPTEYRRVPFFWTNQFMVNTRYVGMARSWDEIVVDGDPDQRQFVACYVQDGKVHAAAGCKQDRKMCMISEIIEAEGLPTLDRVREATRNL